MKKNDLVSIVIPAYNCEKTIEKCLRALEEQSYDDNFEVIVVDDGSSDNTASIVKKHQKIKYLFEKNSGPAAARNKGWKNSKGKIIVFIDSDCVPEKSWLKEMLSDFKNENIGAVGGAYELTVNNYSRLSCLIGEEIKYRYRKIGNFTDAHGSYSFAVRRKILEKINGYNEYYPIATAEDWDLCYRIQDLGYKIVFNKNAKVGHHHPENFWKYLRTQFRHGYYRMKLYKDNPKRLKGDKYSGNAMYQVIFSGLFLVFLFFKPIFSIMFAFCLLFLQIDMILFLTKKYGFIFAIQTAVLQFFRGFAWLIGIIIGLLFNNEFTKRK